jgi:hypothetical protein
MADDYYYADVRRYQTDGDLNATPKYLVDSERLTKTNHFTNTKYVVYYIINIYKTNVANFNTWRTTSPLPGNIVAESPSMPNNPAGFDVNIDYSTGASSAQDPFINKGKVVPSSGGNYYFSVSRKAGTTTGQVFAQPTINIQWKSTASPNLSKITNINWRTTDNEKPSITWSTVKKDPTFPLEAVKKAVKAKTGITPMLQINTIVASNTITIMTDYQYDECSTPKLWNFRLHFGSGDYNELWTCQENGQDCKSSGSPKPGGSGDLSTKAKRTAWEKKVTSAMIRAKSNAGCGGVENSEPTITDATENVKAGALLWNPPVHRDARARSFGEEVNYTNSDEYIPPLEAFADADAIKQGFKQNRRGYIIQTVDGAKALNTNPDVLKDNVGTYNKGHRWGFRFTYNPQSFSYSTTASNSVDWTLGSKDPAVLLAGNQNVSVQLYLNRIPDLKYLRMTNPKVNQTGVYGRQLATSEVQGILNRGTEYDIEYLYRVVNGDPLTQSNLLNYDGVTSDFGYTTGVPCWLALSENLRFFGSISGFSVNHIMFDLNMVPMLSIVDLTFQRYPALFNKKNIYGEKITYSGLSTKYLATQPDPTKTPKAGT